MPHLESPPETRERLEQEAVAWHARLTSGAPAAADLAEFEAWRGQSPAHDQAYRRIESLWRQLEGPLRADLKRRHHAEKSSRTKAWWRRSGAGLAAACAVLATALAFYPDYLFNSWADYHTRIGGRADVQLADGSLIHLNTDTALDVEINGGERRVRLLRGEAEFEVAHDSSRPFRVQSGDTVTEALGTRFVVRYARSAGVITLLQGRVRAARLAPSGEFGTAVVLAPGESAAFDGRSLSEPQAADATASNAWRRGRLIMNFVPLKQVIAEINRYRRSPIKLLDADLGEREINAAIDLGNVDAWLNALPATLPVHIRRAGPFVMIGS